MARITVIKVSGLNCARKEKNAHSLVTQFWGIVRILSFYVPDFKRENIFSQMNYSIIHANGSLYGVVYLTHYI